MLGPRPTGIDQQYTGVDSLDKSYTPIAWPGGGGTTGVAQAAPYTGSTYNPSQWTSYADQYPAATASTPTGGAQIPYPGDQQNHNTTPAPAATTGYVDPLGEAGLSKGWNFTTADRNVDYGSWSDPSSVWLSDNAGGYRQLNQGEQVPTGTAVVIKRAMGTMGMVNDRMSMLGDAKAANPTAGGAKPEIMVNPTGAPFGVLDHAQSMALIQQMKKRGMPGGPMDGAEKAEKKPDKEGKAEDAAENKAKATPKPAARSGKPSVTAMLKRHAAGTNEYGMDPLNTYTTYDPGVMGNMPFYQKLTGRTPSSQFQGFGASVGNDSLGVHGAPTLLNLKNYLSLNPSEQDATASLYGQGLGLDWRDILEQSRRAAPIGQSFGATRYAGT